MADECRWEDTDGEMWLPECEDGEPVNLPGGLSPFALDMEHCPYCGRKVREVHYLEEGNSNG